MKKLYFAYGSNLWPEQMQNRCPGLRIIGAGRLPGYRWIISKRGYANIVKSVLDEVQGLVYEITESDERSLDHYEGVDIGSYRKEMTLVKISGQTYGCLVYVDPIEEEGKPRQEYIERINKGIAASQMPAAYLDRYVPNLYQQSLYDPLRAKPDAPVAWGRYNNRSIMLPSGGRIKPID
jgi:gamma-glutamylcyclotransferase